MTNKGLVGTKRRIKNKKYNAILNSLSDMTKEIYSLGGFEIAILEQEPFKIRHLGLFVYPSEILKLPNGENFIDRGLGSDLLAKEEILGQRIKGVESFAIGYLRVGSKIGIAVSEKLQF